MDGWNIDLEILAGWWHNQTVKDGIDAEAADCSYQQVTQSFENACQLAIPNLFVAANNLWSGTELGVCAAIAQLSVCLVCRASALRVVGQASQ